MSINGTPFALLIVFHNLGNYLEAQGIKKTSENYLERLYDNSDQRRIRTENQIRTKDKFGPNFEIRPKLFR